MKINLYDFDKTIYDGDSSIDFYLFCLKRHLKIIRILPCQIWFAIKYKIGKCTKEEFKSVYFSFMKYITNPEVEVNLFWKNNIKKIKSSFLKETVESKVVISASPEFLLKPICEKININYLIASRVDIKTGVLLGKNCYGKEKVKRLNEMFDSYEVVNAYTDSLSDLPMLKIAKNKFLVKKGKIENYNEIID